MPFARPSELLHRLAHEEPALLLAHLLVAGLVLGDDVGVGGEDRVDGRSERVGVALLRKPTRRDDGRRTGSGAQRFREDLFGLAAVDRPVGDELDELGERVGREREIGRR